MRSPAAALAWLIAWRHRWGIAALGLYLAILAGMRIFALGPDRRVAFGDDWQLAVVVIVPLAATFTYLLAVFSFGFTGDLTGRASMFPAWMLTLPMTSRALAGWPVLYGAATMGALWGATRLLGVWPAGVDVPRGWPGLFAAVVLAWTQALTWMSYRWRGARIMWTILLLVSIDVVVFSALELRASEGTMVILLVPLLALAYGVACRAVRNARRGQGLDRSSLAGDRDGASEATSRSDPPFASPAAAQAWVAWRAWGRALPGWVAVVLPAELALLVPFRDAPVLVWETVIGVLLTPSLLAVFVAANARRRDASRSPGLTPFLATRPLTGASLAGVELRVALRSTLVSWLLIGLTLPLALGLCGGGATVVEGAQRVAEAIGTPRAVGLGVLGLVAFVAATWRRLVQGLCLGMTGRAWLVKGSVFATLVLVTALTTGLYWGMRRPAAIARLWNALPSILVALVLAKTLAAGWIAIRLHESRRLGDRALVLGAAGWSAAVLALYGLLVWLVPTILFPRFLLALVAILAVPGLRIAATPLALAWNRHR